MFGETKKYEEIFPRFITSSKKFSNHLLGQKYLLEKVMWKFGL